MCSVNGSTQCADDEGNALRHQAGDEHDITAQAVQLRDRDFALGLLRRFQRRLQLRPPVERVRTLAGFDLGERGDHLETFGLGERGNGLPLRPRPKPERPASGSSRDSKR